MIGTPYASGIHRCAENSVGFITLAFPVPPPVNDNRENVILCAGTISTRKGQTVLADAFARIAKKFPQWRLIFIGRGGDQEMVRQIQQTVARNQFEKQVELLGPRSDEELRVPVAACRDFRNTLYL